MKEKSKLWIYVCGKENRICLSFLLPPAFSQVLSRHINSEFYFVIVTVRMSWYTDGADSISRHRRGILWQHSYLYFRFPTFKNTDTCNGSNRFACSIVFDQDSVLRGHFKVVRSFQEWRCAVSWVFPVCRKWSAQVEVSTRNWTYCRLPCSELQTALSWPPWTRSKAPARRLVNFLRVTWMSVTHESQF